MLPRTLEPEVMDTAAEARDYDAMDHADVNRRFVDDFLQARDESADSRAEAFRVLDVGTGTAQIPIELASRQAGFQITAIDLAEEMLKLARRNVERAGCDAVVSLEYVDAKRLPYDDHSFDAVISNSIMHHIPRPLEVVAEMVRVLTPGGLLFVRDLLRPESPQEVERLVEAYAGEENAHQQQMFRQSLHAALTLPEVRDLLEAVGLPTARVRQSSDRHWTIRGRLPVADEQPHNRHHR